MSDESLAEGIPITAIENIASQTKSIKEPISSNKEQSLPCEEKTNKSSKLQKFQKGVINQAKKLKKGFKVGAQKTLKLINNVGKRSNKKIIKDESKEGEEDNEDEEKNEGSVKAKKESKYDFKKGLLIGVSVFKEGIRIGYKKLKRSFIIGGEMVRNSFKNAKDNIQRLHAKAKALNAKAREPFKKAKERAKKINEYRKNKARKVGREVKKMGGKIKSSYAKTLKDFVVLGERMKVKRVTFCVWFMYNCHTMKLMFLKCLLIENPQIIINSIKRRESSCATLIPFGYGAIIHKSLILTPFEYFDDSKKALKGEVLIKFGDLKPHSPSASCIGSDSEKQLVFSNLKIGSNPIGNLSSKEISKIQSQDASNSTLNTKSTNSSRIESRFGSKHESSMRSKQASIMAFRSISKSISKVCTPPSTPRKQHTHKLLPTR